MTVLAPARPPAGEAAPPGRGPGAPRPWPLFALLPLYPLWWAVGLSPFVFILAAAPMVVQLAKLPRIRVPRGFWLWLILLAWVVLSGVMLDLTLPGTLPPGGSGRYVGWGVRVLNYAAVTVVLLYVHNVPPDRLPARRLIGWLGVMAGWVVAGGFLGLLLPHLGYTAPLARLLPRAVAADSYVKRLMHIELAQVQDILGERTASARPSAPFEFTNTWGENLAVLLVWFVVGWVVLARGRRRLVGVLVLAAALVPIVSSLNRGLWLGLGIAAAYVTVRLAARGRLRAVVALGAAAAALALVVAVSPLADTVTGRIAHGHSDRIRTTLTTSAVRAANSSPLLGYGGNRALIGSNRSIAIGKRPGCHQCGNREIGSNGQFGYLLVGQGWVGLICYNAFFLWSLWVHRRRRDPVGIAAGTVLVLLLWFQFAYNALPSTLAYAMISLGLLGRGDRPPP
ncbi:MAG TPA: O-antigen ligase domain-containing protein [Pilimelia sp.]|nr:O-antigen ligase domain-containing protein [Pilimelia sp.]